MSSCNSERLPEPLVYSPLADFEAQYHTSASDLAELVLKYYRLLDSQRNTLQ